MYKLRLKKKGEVYGESLKILDSIINEKSELEKNSEKSEVEPKMDFIQQEIDQIYIIYASQTNTGMQYAKETHRMLRENGIQVELFDAGLFEFVSRIK